MNERIKGIDVARAVAVIGMIIVNFKIVLGAEGEGWVKSFAGIFDGKAAATFVVLAGLGLALTTKSAVKKNDQKKLGLIKKVIAKRALFLFVVGISYMAIWPADILHFYGVYIAITILLLSSKSKTILATAVSIIILYPVAMLFLDYETGWNFDTLEYPDFWTVNGFIRNLFFNGFHPVIPWTAFMLFGYWFGKQNLHDKQFIKKTFWISAISFGFIQVLSFLSILILSEENQATTDELTPILGTHPMPPLPLYMFNGIAIAFAIISGCILIAKRFGSNPIINALYQTGQLALTFYVAHVIIGMGAIEVIDPKSMGSYSIEFSLSYALGFSFLCILFAITWTKYKKAGPLEWVMRKLTQ